MQKQAGGVRNQKGERERVGGGGEHAHLGKLEDVLFAVYDLEAAPGEPGAHIPGVQPALLV